MNTRHLTKHWDKLSADEVRHLQGLKLRHYLADHVIPFSKHYRELFAKEGIDPRNIRTIGDLAKIPFTSKRHLVDDPVTGSHTKDFVLVPDEAELRKRPATILRALRHGRAAVKAGFEHEYRPILLTSTTGRSTEPVPFLYTAHDLDVLSITGRRMMEVCESDPAFRHLNLFPFAPHLAFWQAHHAGLGYGTFMLSSGGGKVMGTEGNVRFLDKIKPDAIIGMPTFLYHLLTLAVERGLSVPNLRKIVLGGEKVPPGTRRKLRALCAELGAGKVDVMATYGFTEAKMAWPECPGHGMETPPGYHLSPDLGIIEIIDPETGLTVGEGEPGEIVFTPLDSRGSVVLRYRTGDRISGGLVHSPCPACGRSMPRLVGEISRVTDMKRLRLGKVKGTLVNFNELENLLDNLERVGSWQIELRKRNNDPLDVDEIVVHVAPRGRVSRPSLEREIEERFRETTELTPNRIEFHSAGHLRELHGVGRALKEEKLVDRREAANAGTKPELSTLTES
jgi:phenylacetate-coenzyme A ligase PaaK-like adenylate-forming protein